MKNILIKMIKRLLFKKSIYISQPAELSIMCGGSRRGTELILSSRQVDFPYFKDNQIYTESYIKTDEVFDGKNVYMKI